MVEYFFLFLKLTWCKLRGQVTRNNLGAQTDERLYKNFSLFFKDITASVIIYKSDQSEYIIFHKWVLFLSREAYISSRIVQSSIGWALLIVIMLFEMRRLL